MKTQHSSKIFQTLLVIFSSVLVLQMLVLIILMVQLSDSKMFRILVGFCGTGISVVSVVMGMLPGEPNERNENEPLKINLGIVRSPVWNYLWLGSLIFTVANLFVSFFRNYEITNSIYDSSAYTGSLVLSTSLLAFIIVGARVLIKNPAKDSKGMTLLRMVLLLLFIWIFLKVYSPVFLMLISQAAHNNYVLGFLSMDEFNFRLLTNIFNIYGWHISAIVAFYCQYRFYYKFLWVENLRRAEEMKQEENVNKE